MLTVQKSKSELDTSKSIQYTLYTGAALIVVSMLFLGHDLASTSIFGQALSVLAAPALFYGVGMWVDRKLNAPLAAPGIITTGAWLIGVALFHLYDRRELIPISLQPMYWLAISLAGVVIITLTGHRVRLWLIVPLVPLAQINALWAMFGAFNLPVEWLVPASFALVVLWWELSLKDARMGAIYRVSGSLFAAFLLGFTAWLPRTTDAGFIAACIVGGIVLLRFGARDHQCIATHSGLWLLASAWGKMYFVLQPDGGAFGLWLALLAVGALLIERLTATAHKEKPKSSHTLVETFVNWTFADLVIGLSALVLLWAALHIDAVPVWIITASLSVAVGVWIAAGLLYRLPILLHVALWIAPFPYTLLLILAAPAIWRLPLLGVAWQLFGAALLAFGFFARRYRSSVRTPFFVVGYALSAIGLLTALPDAALFVFSLSGLIVIFGASATAVLLDRHPVWDALIAQVVSPERQPYAYNAMRHAFLLMTAWLAAVWVQLTFGYTNMPLARQGVFVLLFACAWLLIGNLLSNMSTSKPGIPGIMVSSAGWMLWLIGLLQVFFSPTEAVIALVLGLVISGESILRNRGAAHWLPVGIIQIGYTALQIAHMLALPPSLRLVFVCLGAAGMITVVCARTSNRQLPKLALALLGLSGLLFLMSALQQRPIGDALAIYATVLAFAPICAQIVVVFALRSRIPFRRARWLVWWLRPLIPTAFFLAVLSSATLFFALNLYPSVSEIARGVGGLMIAGYFALVYVRRPRLDALIVAFLAFAAALILCLHSVGINTVGSGIIWVTIPTGSMALAFARWSFHPAKYRRLLDFAGTFILIGGAALTMGQNAMIAPEPAIMAAHLIALMTYGYLAGRRIPFASALLILLAGGLIGIFKINLWLVPLSGGMLLLFSALWVETRRTAAESLTQTWLTRWSRWI